MCSLSAGSASLHPRLLIARPPWGRSCYEGLMMSAGGVPAMPGVRCVETRFIASHPLGAQPRHGILSQCRAIRAVRDAMNRVSTWRTSPAGGCQCACRAAVDPIGVVLFITAGKPKAHPRTGSYTTPTPWGANFIPMSCRYGDAWPGALAGDSTALSAGEPAAYPR